MDDFIESEPRVLGSLPPSEAAIKLREIEEYELADLLTSASEFAPRVETFGGFGSNGWPFADKAWQHTSHVFGHIRPVEVGDHLIQISHATNIKADESLKNSRIKVTMDALHVADYPGTGIHRILFDFYGQNQLPTETEDVHFSETYRVAEGESAAVIGYPIFIGLNVGSEGATFKCSTVNVKNDSDEAILDFLESDVFRSGLKLTTSMQPAIAPLAALTVGLTRTLAKRNRNVKVQEFYMGLDFGNIPGRARLAEGAYVVVQIPQSLYSIWDWDSWVYDVSNGQVVNKHTRWQLIPYNYITFSISRYRDA